MTGEHKTIRMKETILIENRNIAKGKKKWKERGIKRRIIALARPNTKDSNRINTIMNKIMNMNMKINMIMIIMRTTFNHRFTCQRRKSP